MLKLKNKLVVSLLLSALLSYSSISSAELLEENNHDYSSNYDFVDFEVYPAKKELPEPLKSFSVDLLSLSQLNFSIKTK